MKLKSIFILIFTMSFFYQCSNNGERPAAGRRAHVVKRVPAVCIIEGASLRDGPSAKAKWMSSIALGERLTWLGISEKDSTKETREYYKVELSDSTIGWTTSYALELRADPAVIVERASVFRRPDLITITQAEFQPMDFVAVVQTEADWLKVVGENRKKKGWVKRSFVSLRGEDVAVGVLTTKALREKKKEKRFQRIKEIIENPAFASSVFIKELIDILNAEKDD